MIDGQKMFECMKDIDDDLIEASEIGNRHGYITYIVGAVKLLAACVLVVLISSVIYENNREAILSSKNNVEEITEKTASVVDVHMFDVGLTEDGRITNKYYAIAAAVGKIHYGGSEYCIVTGINIEETGLNELVATYSAENMRKDLFEGEHIQIDIYELKDMEHDMAIAFSINGETLYYMALNENYIHSN